MADTPNQKALTEMMRRAQGEPINDVSKAWSPSPADKKLVEALGPATTAALLFARDKSWIDMGNGGSPITLDKMRSPDFVKKLLHDRGIDLPLGDIQKINARFALENLKGKFNVPSLEGKTAVDDFYKAVEAHVGSAAHSIPQNQKVLPVKPANKSTIKPM